MLDHIALPLRNRNNVASFICSEWVDYDRLLKSTRNSFVCIEFNRGTSYNRANQPVSAEFTMSLALDAIK